LNTYTIVGPLNVAGHKPGDTVTDEDLDGCSVEHLIGAGHILPINPKTTSVKQATPNQED